MKFRFWHPDRKLRTAWAEGWEKQDFKNKISQRKHSIESCKEQIKVLEQYIKEHKVALEDLEDRLNWMEQEDLK